MITRQRCVATFAAVLAFFLQQDVGRSQQVRPNIVVIMVDDLDTQSLATLIAKGMMPNLKSQIVDVGYDFVESFVTSSVGISSRATFLTGQYAHNHGVLASFPPDGGVTFFNASSTVATWLRTAGYRTGLIGRYLHGYGWWTDGTSIPPGWDDWEALIDPFGYSMYDYKLNYNGTIIDFAELANTYGPLYQTDVLAFLANAFISRAPQDQRPFFVYVNPYVPNIELPVYNECFDPGDGGSWGGNFWGATIRPALRHWNTIFGNDVDFPLPTPPSFNEEDVADKPDWVQSNPPLTAADIDCLQKRYWRKLEAVRAVDDLIGYVFSALAQTGVLGNTVVIFTSDNGKLDGQHRFPEKTPPYEESVRVPLFVRTPWNTLPRRVSRMVVNNDLAPTIAHLAMATTTHRVDGRTLVPLLNNPDYSPWRRIFLLQHGEPRGLEDFTFPPRYLAARVDAPTPRLYVKYPTVTTGLDGELYDLSIDPYELQNIYTDPARAAEVTRLQLWLDALKSCRQLGCYILENYFAFN